MFENGSLMQVSDTFHVYFCFFDNKVISTIHIFYILMFPHPKWFVTGPVADNISSN